MKNKNDKLVKIFGELIRDLRKNKNMSQEELAVIIDSARNYISCLELSSKQPSLTMIFRLCKALGIKVSDLMVKIEEKLEDKKL